MLEFRYLPAFFAVAEHGSFTEAGKQLHIATSAVSRQIQLLEEACGVQLFFRSSREASLTQAGVKLFRELRHFHERAEQALGQEGRGLVRLGSLQGVLVHWLVDVIAETAFFKDINLEIKTGGPGDLLAEVEAGHLDATIFSRVHLTDVPASMRVFRLFPENIVLISKTRIDLDDLASHTWVLLTMKSWLVKYMRKEPEKYILVDNMSAAVELVRKGLGIAMVPSYVLKDHKGLHVYPIEKFSREYLFLVTRRFDLMPRNLDSLLQAFAARCPTWKEVHL